MRIASKKRPPKKDRMATIVRRPRTGAIPVRAADDDAGRGAGSLGADHKVPGKEQEKYKLFYFEYPHPTR